MPYTHKFEPNDELIHEVVEGEVTRPFVEEMARHGLTLGQRHGCRRFLLDWTKAKITASTLDIYLYALELYELGLRHSDRVAVIIPDDKDERNNHRFFETVTKNRGWYNIHYFEDAHSAATWLGHGDGAEPFHTD